MFPVTLELDRSRKEGRSCKGYYRISLQFAILTIDLNTIAQKPRNSIDTTVESTVNVLFFEMTRIILSIML